MPGPDAADRVAAARAVLNGTSRQPACDLPMPQLRRQHAHLARAVRDMLTLTDGPHEHERLVLDTATRSVERADEHTWLEDGHAALRATLGRLLNEVQP